MQLLSHQPEHSHRARCGLCSLAYEGFCCGVGAFGLWWSAETLVFANMDPAES